ncbi:MAG: alpha/beta hydrolase, partial [Gammaproteobacteria bacterium]|nr:alpha/beta hydrolase [Gammaproteobacteria bacterium]
VQGLYLTFIPGGLAPAVTAAELAYSPAEMQLLAARQRWEREEGGYEHLQSTKPQTLAYGLTDSPAGLAAWLLEKWRAWSDCDGEVTRVIPLDWLLTNICIYWFTRTLASSVRLYHETRLHPWAPPAGCRIETPTGIASFPKELSVPPPEWARRIYNVQHWTDMPRGGHFAAIEQPALVAEDLRRFARRLR